MIKTGDKKTCCGCSACKNACPYGAISMERDALGFEYPAVDEDICTGCGVCEKVCGFLSPALNPEGTAIGARLKDPAGLMASQSGGAFAAISDIILADGGAVWGAAFNDDFSVAHRKAGTKSERDAFRGSKYVQSSLGDCYRDIMNDLDNGRKVLFSGTPCQVNGLISIAGNHPGLYTTDIICHGVPSPEVWKAYLGLMEKEAGSLIVKASFRDKARFGWHDHRESFSFADGTRTDSRSYTDIFYKHLMMRPSCTECPFNSTARVSDITIGDLWRTDKSLPDIYPDNKGISLVLLNTEKGRRLWQECSSSVEGAPIDLNDYLQRPLKENVDRNPLSDNFEKDFHERGIGYVLKRYGDRNLHSRVSYTYRRLRRTARKILLGK